MTPFQWIISEIAEEQLSFGVNVFSAEKQQQGAKKTPFLIKLANIDFKQQ